MLKKIGLLIVYCTTIVFSKQIFKELYRSPPSDIRIFQRMREHKVLQPNSDEDYPPDKHIVEFNVNGEKINLNLTLSKRDVVSHDVPIWLIKTHLEQMPNYTYKLLKDTKHMFNGRFFIDNDNKAVLFARYNEKQNKYLYDGVIGEGSTRRLVHSIPDEGHTRSKRSTEEIESHIVIESPESFDSDEESIIIERNGVELTKLKKPLEILYPKILVVVDYHLFRYLNLDIAETIRYVATFWNIVDQKYAKIHSPPIQIVVTGIIIINDEKVLDNIYRYESGTEEFDIHELLNNARLYFSEKFTDDTGFKDYDAIMIMTGLKMKSLEGLVNIFGLTAKLGAICTKDYNIAVTTDKADYNTLIAVHELGHLLNLSHDFADECDGITYLFDPLKTSVMSIPSDGADIFWSECSLRLLKEFSTLKAAECLRNRHRTE